jgi:hypothetical protein
LKQATLEEFEDSEESETKNQASLRELAWLSGELREVMKRSGGAGVFVVMDKGWPMEVFEVKRRVGAAAGGGSGRVLRWMEVVQPWLQSWYRTSTDY